MTAIQAISIKGHEERSTPKPHTVYRIDIQATVRSWPMWRRYSEFVDLHTELAKSTGAPPPATLPPKHSFSLSRFSLGSDRDNGLLEERRTGLEAYLRAIIGAKDDRWRSAYAFREFLGVPAGRQGTTDGSGGLTGGFSSSSWLDEHLEMQSRIRDIRAEINKRDALSERGDVAASNKSNVQAKKTLAEVLSKVRVLAKGLQDLGMAGMSEGELQRRTDMVGRIQDDCEKLAKMVTVARMTSRVGGASTSTSAAGSQTLAPESDRAALLGGNGFKSSRVFGAPQPKETEETRPLDSQGLFQLQQSRMDQQDDQVSQLTTILQRQRHLGEAINHELGEQITMLDGLTEDVDRVGGKLTAAKKQLNRLG